jgi:ATP-dependent DNA helicase RecQ
MIDQARAVLKKYWGYPDFRPGQDRVITSIMEGKDTVVLFPTGGGKSICFQVPAVALEGFALVISPLVALMEDQVYQLQERNIRATFINSTIKRYEIEQRLINARNGMYKLLYCAPERLHTPLFSEMLHQMPISFVAVDEAHCISEWGHRFRPSYRAIREGLQAYDRELPVMALTATATPRVEEDIITNLNLDNAVIERKGYIRENLHYWVTETENKRGMLLKLINRTRKNESGLVYGGTRRECEEIASLLSRKGYKAEAYHAGFTAENRKAIQERWISGKTPWVASTNAFGMGIDKPDCRYVIHLHPPSSIEAYYQEAGRAGRDGAASYPVLLYSKSDFRFANDMLEQSHPDWEVLNHTYQILCDELDLALGSEQIESTAIDIAHLAKRSGQNKKLVIKALQVLDSLGILSMIENYQPEIGITFNFSRDAMLDQIERYENHMKREFVESIYRLFGGHRSEEWLYLKKSTIENSLDLSYQKMLKGLDVLQSERILKYEERDGTPVIFLAEPRQPLLPVIKTEIEHYRENQKEKLDLMHQYCASQRCRNQYFSAYFGDIKEGYKCGVCDNCQKYGMGNSDDKVEELADLEFEIEQILGKGDHSYKELVEKVDADEDRIQEHIQSMIAAGIVERKSSPEGNDKIGFVD